MQNIACSTQVLDRNTEKVAEARFNGPVAGSVWIRWLGGSASEDSTDTIIHTNLQHNSDTNSMNESSTEHHWKIYVTDIFDTGKGI